MYVPPAPNVDHAHKPLSPTRQPRAYGQAYSSAPHMAAAAAGPLGPPPRHSCDSSPKNNMTITEHNIGIAECNCGADNCIGLLTIEFPAKTSAWIETDDMGRIVEMTIDLYEAEQLARAMFRLATATINDELGKSR
jgi:hypothetical protein